MENIKKITDCDGHWYWIPLDLIAEFNEDLEKIEGAEYMDCPDNFDNFSCKYEKYRTGGSPDLTPDYFIKLNKQ